MAALEARIRALEQVRPLQTVKPDPAEFQDWLAAGIAQAERERTEYDALPVAAKLAHKRAELDDLQTLRPALYSPLYDLKETMTASLIRTVESEITELELSTDA
jgi:prophage antirepressor-like protein